MSLTRKQSQLLAYITDRLMIDNVSPSYDEMRVALGLKSKSGVNRLVNALEERKYISRLHNRARAIELVKAHGDGRTPYALETFSTRELIAELSRRVAYRPVLGTGGAK